MKDLIQAIVKQTVDNASLSRIIQAEVVNPPPYLKIRLAGSSNLVIPNDLILVSEHLTNYASRMFINGEMTDIITYNELRIGDQVVCLSFDGGQIYYIIDRYRKY